MRHKLCELTQEGNAGRSNSIDCRNLVEQVGEPHELTIIGHIHAPDGVIDQFLTNTQLVTDGFFTIVHHRCTDVEILVESIIKVQSQ